MKVIIPPIKSQGIKTKLVPWILELAAPFNGRWIEPFLGTGVVAFNARRDEALLNDINPHIINFYKQIQSGVITPFVVRNYLQEEGEKLRTSDDNGYAHFRLVKERFNKFHNPLDFLFLSRSGFNGMIRFNNKGNWNIPFCKKPNRFDASYITKIVNQVTSISLIIKKGWIFENVSFDKIISQATKNDIIYCDPPYFGRYVDYYNGWSESDEKLLYDLLCENKTNFILSTWHHNDYRNNEMIDKYWSNFNIVTRDHFYHSGGKIENRKSIVEALVFNFDSSICNHNHDILLNRNRIIKSEVLSLFS